MANIHSVQLTLTHSLVTALGYRSLPAWHPAPAQSPLHSVPRGPLLQGGLTPDLALTTSCASLKASPQLRFFTRWRVLAAWSIRGWVFGTFPTLSDANLSLDAWTLTPALSVVPVPGAFALPAKT